MKNVIFFCIVMSFVLIVMEGCGAPITEDNPLGISDPNQAQLWFDAGVTSGQAVQGVGVATGNPAMIAMGAALVTLGMWLTNNVLKKEKKDGES